MPRWACMYVGGEGRRGRGEAGAGTEMGAGAEGSPLSIQKEVAGCTEWDTV